MNFDNIFLNKKDLKIIKCLKYNHANLWELHGYFNFPGIEDILTSIGKLSQNNLIIEETINNDTRYFISATGKDYLKYLSIQKHKKCRNTIITLLTVFAALATIAGFVLPRITNWLL